MPVGDIRRDRLSAGQMMEENGTTRTLPVPTGAEIAPAHVSPIAQLADIPEEEIWLAKQKSARTRRAYRLDVQHFMRRLAITDARGAAPGGPPGGDRLGAQHARDRARRAVDGPPPARGAVLAVQAPGAPRPCREKPGRRDRAAGDQPRRRLDRSPSRRRRRASCSTCRREDTIEGLRDRAILSVGLQVGLRRAEIAALTVGDLHQNRGYDSLRVVRKGGRRDALAINPQTAARLRAYLERAGHGDDIDGPLFRPLQHNGKRRDERRRHGPRRDRPRGAQIRRRARARSRLLGALDARDLHHHGAGKRRPARRRAEGRRAPRPEHDQALRPARLQSGEGGVVFCDLLNSRSELRSSSFAGRFPMWPTGLLCLSPIQPSLKNGWYLSSLPLGQSGEHVHPRGGDVFDRGADDGGLQQSNAVLGASSMNPITLFLARLRSRGARPWPMLEPIFAAPFVILAVIIALSVKVANAWQRFVILRAGNFMGVHGPGCS